MSEAVTDEVRNEVMLTVTVELESMFTVLANAYYDPKFSQHKLVARQVEASLRKWLGASEQNTFAP